MKPSLTHPLVFLFFLLSTSSIFSQKDYFENQEFTEADTLRGMLRAERTCYDVTFYDLQLKVDVDKKFIKGYNEIHYKAIDDFTRLQVDLFDNMKINNISFKGKKLKYERIHNAVFIDFPRQKKGVSGSFRVHYEGNPTVAKNAPWDGGFTWAKDENGDDWVGVSCEGIGASLWYPNKDHLSDEPDSMRIGTSVPKGLMCMANGNLVNAIDVGSGYTHYDWMVTYPINNYNVSLNIANYAHFSDTYKSQDGEILDLDYYVLPYNLEKAKKHFEQVKPMLECYENLFGKYPFWKDGYALVETPYLGMEHQGAIAYGNRYMNGYLGGMIPRGIEFDYIIIHETGHEYWGNSVSCEDHAEMWIHESFCTYTEALYVECKYNYTEAIRYLNFQKNFLDNRKPMVGPLEVNFEDFGGSDIYYKGAWVLQTLRSVVNDDDLWFDLMKSLHKEFEISTVSTPQIIEFINKKTKKDFSKFFEQYLYHPKVPLLLYKIEEKGNDLNLTAKWQADVKGFEMPIFVGENGKYQQILVTSSKKDFTIKNISLDNFKIAEELFLIDVYEVKGDGK